MRRPSRRPVVLLWAALTLTVVGTAAPAPAGAGTPAAPGTLVSWQSYDGSLHREDVFLVAGRAPSPDGSLYAAGYTDHSVTAGTRILVARYAAVTGMSEWIRPYDVPGASAASARALATDSLGNVVVTGECWDGHDFDLVTMKIDAFGSVVWTAVKDGAAGLDDSCADVAVDANGDVYVCGSVDGGAKAVIIKYASAADPARPGVGVQLWLRSTVGTGTPARAHATSIVCSDGRVYVTGGRRMTDRRNDVFLRCLGEDGSSKWTRNWDGGRSLDDDGREVVARAGSLFVAGSTATRRRGSDVVVLRYSADGRRAWARTWDGVAHGNDEFRSLGVDDRGRCYICGSSFSSAVLHKGVLVKFGADGEWRWTRTYRRAEGENSSSFTALSAGRSGTVWVVGYVEADIYSSWLAARYTTAGDLVWLSRRFEPPDVETGTALFACVPCITELLFVAGEIQFAGRDSTDAAVGWYAR